MESIYSKHKPTTGGGDYLKLKDGDKVKMRIASEPAISVYKAGDRPRYSWVVHNRDEDKAQVYTAGVSVFKQIAALTEDWGLPTDFDIRVSRSGSGMNDTEYIVTPVKISDDLTEEELGEASKVDLIAAIKGKTLANFEKDGILPLPNKTDDAPVDDAPLPTDEEINLSDIPF